MNERECNVMNRAEDDTLSEAAFGQLDGYLAQLQAGQRPDRDAVLASFPHLSDTLACLEALELLAPPLDGAPQCAQPGNRNGADAVAGAATPQGNFDFGSYEVEAANEKKALGDKTVDFTRPSTQYIVP